MNEEYTHKIKVTATAFKEPDGDFVQIDTDIMGKASREIINMKEKAVKKALMDLGWTPPIKKERSFREYSFANIRRKLGQMMSRRLDDKYGEERQEKTQ